MNNKGLAVVVSCFSSIILYLVIYLPINYFWGESLWLSIGLMVVVYGVMELVKLVIYQKRSYSALNKTSIWLIILGYIVFINWTYKPIYNDLFYDSYNGKYGIDEYICQN